MITEIILAGNEAASKSSQTGTMFVGTNEPTIKVQGMWCRRCSGAARGMYGNRAVPYQGCSSMSGIQKSGN